MTVAVNIVFRNDNPNTIWNRLAAKLGREPTNAEAAAEVSRILDEGLAELAGDGKLRWQRGRAA
jgi:hypothetical protein